LSQTQEKQNRWTIIQLINWTTKHLMEKGFENSRLNAEILLAHTLKCNRVKLYLDFDRPLQADELAEFKVLLKRRLNHEPLQYITGQCEFMSLPFTVGPGALIPRPETEMLVELTLEHCKTLVENNPHPVILDIGAGSGNIAISLAHYNPDCQITAVDISEAALNIARRNAVLNNVESCIQFIQMDIMNCKLEHLHNYFDIIVSNPPYIDAAGYERLPEEIKAHEPQISLLAGQEGLDFYIHFPDFFIYLLKEKGIAFFEIGELQASSIKQIFNRPEFEPVEIFCDLAGKDRIIKVKKR